MMFQKRLLKKWCSKGWASKVQKKKGFAKIDANNDGVISEEEFNASINTDEL